MRYEGSAAFLTVPDSGLRRRWEIERMWTNVDLNGFGSLSVSCVDLLPQVFTIEITPAPHTHHVPYICPALVVPPCLTVLEEQCFNSP